VIWRRHHASVTFTWCAPAITFRFPPFQEATMRFRSRASALFISRRLIVVGALTTLAEACAQSDATAPIREATILRTVVGSAPATSNGQGPQACTPDTKLIGRFAVSTADVAGTWWRLSKDRFDALGVSDYKAALEGFYGQSFASLDDAIHYLIAGVASYDANGNGYVCAFEVNGIRAHLGVNALFLIGIADDKHVEQ
jgi:hypothetical protein